MNYKVYLYVIMTALSIYALSGINFNAIIKKNKSLETKILVVIIAFCLGYLATNFITDFISIMGK